MHPDILFAGQRLSVRLGEEGFRAQPVNSMSSMYAMGYLWIVILSWPKRKRVAIKREVATIRTWTRRIGRAYGLVGQDYGPTIAVGGVYVMYCGFETEFLRRADSIARGRQQPVWKVCEEDPELRTLRYTATSPQFR